MSDTDEEAESKPKAGEAQKSNKLASQFVLGAFGLVGLGMLGIYLSLRPSGDAVGQLDLLKADATLVVDGAVGDEITCVSRITTGLGRFEGPSSKNRANGATRAMASSTLTVVVVDPDGNEQTSSCGLWDGSMGSDRNDTQLTENNVVNDCEVVLKATGKHTVRASVKWHPALALEAAQTTVYRAR